MTRINSISLVLAVAVAASGCGGEKKAEGPEAAVEAFYEAVAAGDWETAEAFCDGDAMESYVGEYRKVREGLQQGDANALNIASSILEDLEVKVDRTERTDEGRMIYYSLEVGEFSKERKALVRKEEGEWRVMEITDVI